MSKLVSVIFDRSWSMWHPRMQAGFEPARAEFLVKSGIAHYAGEKPAPTADVVPPKPPAPKRVFDVEIPDNWDVVGPGKHLVRISIAKKLEPDEESINDERAREIIETELARRDAAED